MYDTVKYWALPDLLEPFVSSLSQAPITASNRNIYLPSTAVYGQWCASSSRRAGPVSQEGFSAAGPRMTSSISERLGGFAVDRGMGSSLAVLTLKTSIPTLSLADVEYTDSFEKYFCSRDNTVVIYGPRRNSIQCYTNLNNDHQEHRKAQHPTRPRGRVSVHLLSFFMVANDPSCLP